MADQLVQKVPVEKRQTLDIIFSKVESSVQKSNSRLRRVVGHCVVADILSALGTRKLGLFFKGTRNKVCFREKEHNLENAEGQRGKKVASSEKSGCRSQGEPRISLTTNFNVAILDKFHLTFQKIGDILKLGDFAKAIAALLLHHGEILLVNNRCSPRQ